jgi:hypothetical protein
MSPARAGAGATLGAVQQHEEATMTDDAEKVEFEEQTALVDGVPDGDDIPDESDDPNANRSVDAEDNEA